MFQIMFLMAMQEFSNLKIINIRSEFSSIRDFPNAPELNFNTDKNVFSNNVYQPWGKSNNKEIINIIKELEPEYEYWEWNGLLIIKENVSAIDSD